MKNIKNQIKNCKLFFSVTMLAILAHEIPSVRSVVKQIVGWPQHVFNLPDYTGLIAMQHYLIDKVLLLVTLASLVYYVVCAGILRIRSKRVKKAKGDNAFETSLLRYLNNSVTSGCYLISGRWGVGKTYMLNEFLKRYFKDSDRRVYKVSCFGLATREEIIEELNNVIAADDSSLNAIIVNIFSWIPVIGDFLGHLFKKTYGYSNVKADSVFVFEDFERLSQPIRIKQNEDELNNMSRSLKPNENEMLFSEIRKNTEALKEIKDALRFEMEKDNYDKYLAIVGVINELVDQRNCRAIIVCNTDMVGERFISDTIREKLNCCEYKKNLDPNSRKQLVKEILEKFVIENEHKSAQIKEYVNNLNCQRIGVNLGTSNLRIFANIIEAFITTASLFDVEVLALDEFMGSLLLSILAVNAMKSPTEKTMIKLQPIGKNIGLFYNVKRGGEYKGCKWLGYSVSAYFLNNLELPSNLDDIVEAWHNYKYSDIEKSMMARDYKGFDNYDYGVFHFCWLIETSDTYGDKADWIKYLDKAIEDYNLRNKAELNRLLNDFTKYMHSYSDEVNNVIFAEIANRSGKMHADSDSGFATSYNRYLSSHK